LEGGKIMHRLQLTKNTFSDDPTRHAWEEMHAEVLHELQEGGDVPDALLDAIADTVASIRFQGIKPESPKVKLSTTQLPDPLKLAQPKK
jgi:hypothetical protein